MSRSVPAANTVLFFIDLSMICRGAFNVVPGRIAVDGINT
jgi:hypothetical protein